MGRALALHPMLILAVVSVGGILGGVLGAALAPPIAAAAVATGSFLRQWRREADGARRQLTPEAAAS
jgi:predicted PurR-regulated permease PerM